VAIVTCILGALTFYLTVIRDSDQSGDKKVEIRQKEADLFYKQSEIQRAKDAAKADFLQKNLALLTSAQPDSMRQAEALIDASFSSPEDVLDVKTKVRHIHESVSLTLPYAGTARLHLLDLVMSPPITAPAWRQNKLMDMRIFLRRWWASS